MGLRKICLCAIALSMATSVWASSDRVPECLSNGQELPVNNGQVLQWKNSTRNQYTNRGHIEGTLLQVYHTTDRDHAHMEVRIGPNSGDTLEVIFSLDFGHLPQLRPGDDIEACGVYKTSNKQAGYYAPSPDGAIMHWLHRSNSAHHDSGYLAVDGAVYGD